MLNVIVLVVVTASIIAMPVRKTWLARNDPHRVAETRGRVLAQAFDQIAITNRGSATAILRCVDPHLELSALPGVPSPDGLPRIAWSVVDLPDDAPRDLPLLISRNVRAASLASLTGRVADAVADEPPFGTNSVVIVARGGRVTTIQGDALNGPWSAFLGPRPPALPVHRP